MDRPARVTPERRLAETRTGHGPRPDEPCGGLDSRCRRSCYLDSGTWTYATTIAPGGIEIDVEAYCMCEHHEGDPRLGPEVGLTTHIEALVARARQARPR